MDIYSIIEKKRDGKALRESDIKYFIENYTGGMIPDYQASALLMAIFLNKMTDEEIFHLTSAMLKSGDIIDLKSIRGIKVDKHSTGGVGDKTTLIVAPIAAACGVPVAKLSGRGLGFTGGTVDKMESISGFKTSMDTDEFLHQVNKVGVALTGQTGSIAPADKKIYALRDVTATVDDIGLIASSIMSKKLASGSDAIVLDVKCGSGAFMHSIEKAEQLAKTMVEIGNRAGKKTVAMITNMEEPLGYAVGNALEVKEVFDTLKLKGPKDVTELSLALAGMMIFVGGKAESYEEGCKKAEKALNSGAALKKIKELIEAQGGEGSVVEDYSLLPQAKIEKKYQAEKSGYITAIDARTIGEASKHSGAGRTTKEEDIDLSAGIVLNKKVGEQVEKGEVLMTVKGNEAYKLEEALKVGSHAFVIEENRIEPEKLIRKIIY